MIFEYSIIIIYTLALLIIFLYSLAQLNLLFNYLNVKNDDENLEKFNLLNDNEIPFVTIQLPVFNELYVMERLLHCISKINYPKEKLEIQVLDDSTDESVIFTANKITELQKAGLDIKHIQRKNRKGFKAGALKEGLKIAKGDFIAIFDADFLPKDDWLFQTVPYFKNPEIGVVQTRWTHINRNYSVLTRIQAFALDAHFTLEQIGRNVKNHFINFNGTAGIWRKECIYDAGNWQGDTLTEDLDLSYRAQLKKWKFKYLENVETPAELPVTISASRSQQFRWNKGAAENFQKLIRKVIASKNTSFKTKIHSFLHLLNSSMFLNIFLVAILSVPVLYLKNEHAHLKIYFYLMSFFITSTFIFFIFYWFSYKKIHGTSVVNFIKYIANFFMFFTIIIGFSWQNSLAVLEGHFGKKSEFVRTPKFNISSKKEVWKKNKYARKKISINVFIEGILMCYFAFGMYTAFTFEKQDFTFFPFHLMLFLGFAYIFFNSIFERK